MKNKLVWFAAGAVVSFVFKNQIGETLNKAIKEIQKQNEGEG